MRLCVFRLCLSLAMAVAARGEARAQPPPNLADLLPDLILRDITLPRPITGFSHVAHFSPLEGNELDNPAVGIVRSFNKLMMVQLSTFPLGSSAGGFTSAGRPFHRGAKDSKNRPAALGPVRPSGMQTTQMTG